METKKIIPIVVAILIIIVGISFYVKTHKKEDCYTKLIIEINEEATEIDKISVGYKIDAIDADIIATEGNKIVVRSNNGNDTEIKLNQSKKICNTNDVCAIITLK